MYNKLFTKILDSSVWLEPTPTRIVWVTFIAAMDELGIARFASVANVAHRARVSLGEAETAVTALENPDMISAGQDGEGRRIERVPDGWLVLNAEKYRALVTKATLQEQTRARVRRHRALKRVVTPVTQVTQSNELVTQSEADQIRSEEKKVLGNGGTGNDDALQAQDQDGGRDVDGTLAQRIAEKVAFEESARRRRRPFR